jgi:hypothetical protein
MDSVLVSNRKLEIDLSAVQGSADFHLLQEFSASGECLESADFHLLQELSASGVCLKEDLHL